VTYAPLFVWPPRSLAVVKWVLSYPGFLWPWNSFFLLITIGTWLYFQPALSTCIEFRFGWILQMYLRNMVLLWLIAGGWHLLLYNLKLEGATKKYDKRWPSTKSPAFLWRNQVLDNIFWSCVSGCTIWTAYEVFFMWSYANGYLPYVDWRESPVYCALWLCAIPFWREFHFYWIHRAIHWKPLYRKVHYLHHLNVNPGPWSGMAMHPVEHLLYFSVVLIHLIIPSHPLHFLFNAQHTALTTAHGHSGFHGNVFGNTVPQGSYFHYLHHRYFECNYGETALPLDKLFGTFHDGSEEATRATRQRRKGVS
jgi:sterol desaturase/sphingolipid hydroxylase (fatty acid hydroxylase superfamily)